METHQIVFLEKMLILQMKLELSLDLVIQKLVTEENCLKSMSLLSAMQNVSSSTFIIIQTLTDMPQKKFAKLSLMVLVMECSARKEYIMRMRRDLLIWETKFLVRHVKVTVEDLLKLKMLKEGVPWLELFQVERLTISLFSLTSFNLI